MLKGMSKLLTGDLLKALCDMGHGDRVAITDANFPAHTVSKMVLTFPGCSATEILATILPIFPVDHIEKEPVLLMDMTEEDRAEMEEPGIWKEFCDIIRTEYGESRKVGKISRNEFYDASRGCSLIIQSGEERLYGNIILTKGVVK